MYSNRSEHSLSRQYSDRGSRQRDSYDDRWERRELHRDVQRDSQHKYVGDGHSSTERTSRSKEYCNSPKRPYGKDLLSRERGRKSPVRRRMSSPDWSASERKRRRFTEGNDDDYRNRRMFEEKGSRQSPDGFPRENMTKDFKHVLPQEEDFKYRKTTQESKHRSRHAEFNSRQRHDDSTCRRSSGYFKDRDGHERNWEHSPERTKDHSAKYVEKEVTQQSAAFPEQKRSTNGFQRFLDVLNKGVNVATLTKIVTQTSTKVDNASQSPTSFMNTADQPWSPVCAGRQQNIRDWSESEAPQRRASPQSRHRSFSPKGRSLSDEKSLQSGDGEQNYFNSNDRAGSPLVVERITLTPEDEHKHKHMQDVLQAIGMNLGFEELGQMSHRIQERLYGKKDGEVGRQHRASRERDTRRAFSPRLHNRSSSSRSSFSPSPREYYMKEDSYSSQRDVTGAEQTQAHQAVEYSLNNSDSILHESEKCKSNSQESTGAHQAFPQNPSYNLPEPSPSPVMPMYSPYPALPPNLPHVGPGIFLPRLPHFLPYPQVPPLNVFPAVLTQTRHLLPQHMINPQPVFNLPTQPLNTAQKAKTQSRPRCLQVIETKQPG